jgi:hypothetical protein
MLYAQISKDRWDSLPDEWDEVNDMFDYLHKMVWGYQITFESRMFSTQYGAQYRCSLVRWSSEIPTARHTQTNPPQKNREVLLETSEPEQMKATLFMLINEAEVEYKAAKQRVSMIP